MTEALDLIAPLAEAMMKRGWANFENTGDESAQARAVAETMRMHTWAIRGEFYGEQILRIFLPFVRPRRPSACHDWGIAPLCAGGHARCGPSSERG